MDARRDVNGQDTNQVSQTLSINVLDVPTGIESDDSGINSPNCFDIDLDKARADASALTTALKDLKISQHEEQGFKKKTQKSCLLKSKKTRNSERKVVRFADSFGNALTTVKIVADTEVPPTIPKAAFADLNIEKSAVKPKLTKTYELVPEFVPAGMAMYPGNFLHRVKEQKVCLESVSVDGLSFSGIIRVSNVAFEKEVFIRYSLDRFWSHSYDVAASYVPNSSQNDTDQFRFVLYAPLAFHTGDTLTFVIRYKAGGIEYWDNNWSMDYRMNAKPVFKYSK